MSNPALTTDQNLLPVQAYFNVDGSFNTFIGQGQPFYATSNPYQSGLTITNSTIDSTTIGATTPSTGVFSSGQVLAAPVGATDITNKQYVDYLAAGLSWKEPVTAATTVAGGNITLSGLQTIDTVSLVAGNTVLVKNQTAASQNGIYTVVSGAWTRTPGSDTWNEYVGAIVFVVQGSQAGTAWYCTAQPGGTLGTTAINWSNFSVASSYTAGTGLTLSGTQFSITNTAVSAGSYGSASSVPTYTVNAQGQLTAASNTTIAIANTQVSGLGTLSTQNASSVSITGGSINGTSIGGSSPSTGVFTTLGGTTITASTQFSGPGTGLTGTATSLNIGGNAATATSATSATSATTATNLASGANGSIPYQTGSGATTFLGIGSTGQFLTVSGGVPAWASISSSAVTSFSAGTTGFTPSSATTGAITLSGTLNVANGGTGVTSSSGANSVVLRDANGNVTTNCLFEGYVNQAASGTTITLTASTAQNYAINGSGGQTIQLPNATTLPNGASFTFNNNQSSGTIVVQNNSATTVATVQSGSYITVVLLSNSSAAGTWDFHNSPPANASWSTNTLSWAGSYTNGTWNGNVIGLAYGGTNANLTAVAGGAVYSSGSALGITAAGTSGQVLTSNGASAPTWQNNSATVSITDDTSTNATRYPLFSSITTGNITTEYTSSTKFQYNPSTGVLSATTFSGAGTSLTGTASSLTAGTASALTTGNSYQVGSLGVGTAASGTTGEIRATNNVTAYYSSDIRLKSNIKDISNALDKVTHIGGKTFDWSDDYIAEHGGEDGYFVQKSDFGVIAQDVQEVFPQAVRTRNDGTLAVDYAKLSALAFAAIAELKVRIEQLESK